MVITHEIVPRFFDGCVQKLIFRRSFPLDPRLDESLTDRESSTRAIA